MMRCILEKEIKITKDKYSEKERRTEGEEEGVDTKGEEIGSTELVDRMKDRNGRAVNRQRYNVDMQMING